MLCRRLLHEDCCFVLSHSLHVAGERAGHELPQLRQAGMICGFPFLPIRFNLFLITLANRIHMRSVQKHLWRRFNKVQ